jgi:hypothetical protein
MLKNLLCLQFTNFCDELQHLSQASLSTSVMFVDKAVAYPSDESALALPANVRLGWKGLPGANTLAYCKN